LTVPGSKADDVVVDVLYLSWNRRAFTEITFDLLLRNTDWGLVSKLFVYDDASDDGTLEFLTAAVEACPVEFQIHSARRRSPVAVMNEYCSSGRVSDVFCKIDSDIAVPAGWLEALLGVLERNPELEVLGMEAGMTWLPGRDGRVFDGVYGWREASHIGGIGAIRQTALTHRPRIPANGLFGFTEWQAKYRPIRGWIEPDLLCPALDRIPIEPYASLSDMYIEQGYQRPWPRYEHWGEPYFSWLVEGSR
jgi:glycosyltransferase involved in cell wall biosynthesis